MSAPVPSPSPHTDRIRAVNHHLRLALDQVSDAVLILQNGIGEISGPVIVWGNAAAVRWAGLPLTELAGASLPQLLAADSWKSLQVALRVAFQGQPSVCHVRSRMEGSVPAEATAKAVLGAAGEILSVILTFCPGVPDAAGMAQSHGWRAQGKSAQLRRPVPSEPGPPPSPQGWQGDIIETIRETARQVAHEFNNALTSIVLPVEMAIQAIPRSGQLFESLQVAHASAHRAADLARDFLDRFRPRPAVRGICAAGDLLGRAMRLATCAQNITSSLQLAEGLEAIDVDEGQLERVIFNLIRNSCQAMPNGGRLRVTADNFQVCHGDGVALPPGPYVRICVRDWGPGIPEEYRRHLFHSRFSTKPDGNGCGLPICYKIIRDHGGEMMVRSRVHLGTEFIIYLPSAGAASAVCKSDRQRCAELSPAFRALPGPSHPASPGADAVGGADFRTPGPGGKNGMSPAGSPAPGHGGGTGMVPPPSLLVVDDELGVRQALGQIARGRGFDVATVANSDAALQSYKDRLRAGRAFSAVLLDLNLRSGLNGLEVFAELRHADPAVSVVATSGQHAEGDVERFKAMGFAGFLAKPYSLERFDCVMREALGL